MAMPFLLDTDTCIYALKQNENVIARLLSTPREDVMVSVITEAELRTGASKSSSVKNRRAGPPIGPLDTLLASQAVSRKLTLVSNNEREFRRVAGLTIENWLR